MDEDLLIIFLMDAAVSLCSADVNSPLSGICKSFFAFVIKELFLGELSLGELDDVSIFANIALALST